MKDDRNTMFFPGTTGMGMPPMGAQMGQMMPGMTTQGMGGFQGPMVPNAGMLENRIASLERQIKRLDARLGRLETPFPTPTPQPTTTPSPFGNTGQPPFNTQQEMGQDNVMTYPYQTAMQIM